MIETVIHLPYHYQVREANESRMLLLFPVDQDGAPTGQNITIWFDRLSATAIGKALLGFSEEEDATATILDVKGKPIEDREEPVREAPVNGTEPRSPERAPSE